MKIKGLLFIAFLATLFFNCDPAKKMQRICKKHPDVCKRDTIKKTIIDSIKTPHIVVDTVFIQGENNTDTVYIVKDNLVIKYKYNPATKQVYISGEVKPQTHIFKHEVTIVNTEVTFRKHWSDYISLALTILGSIVFLWAFFKNKKP